jgi:pimeloyl-ACP methyl ester carboxylesterase
MSPRPQPPTPASPRAVQLSDGRRLTFRDAGPRDGFPVILCHGAIGAPRWCSADLETLLETEEIRYLALNRPGYAGSDPAPGRTVAGFAADLETVLDRLAIRRCAVVGVSAGAPYALAAAWGLPDRVAGVSIVSPLGPAAGAGAMRGLRYRAMLLPFGPGRLREGITGASLRALGRHRGTPVRAMVDDYRVCRAPWGFAPAEVQVPVTVWHGRSDKLIPLAHGRGLATAIPTCEALIEAEGGHLFFNQAIPRIVGELVPRRAEREPLVLAA